METCTASICSGRDPCRSSSQRKDGTRQEPAEEGELASVVGEGPARSMSLRALLAQAGGERETRAGERFETGDALGQVGRKRLTMDVKESYTEPEDETGR